MWFETLAFAVSTGLQIFFAAQLERERIRNRKREQSLVDQVIQTAATKRWEDFAQLRKEMFLAELDASNRKPQNGVSAYETPTGEQIPAEVAHSY